MLHAVWVWDSRQWNGPCESDLFFSFFSSRTLEGSYWNVIVVFVTRGLYPPPLATVLAAVNMPLMAGTKFLSARAATQNTSFPPSFC